jgi:uncharacterized glyoxalase superfamily protein PhnB
MGSTNSPLPPGVQTRRSAPESFRARALQASLTVKDLQASLAWYRDVASFTVDREIERGGKVVAVALKAGDVRIMINQDDGAKGTDRLKGAGLSLMFVTAQSVDDVAKRIKERGGVLDTEPTDMPWGARLFKVRDPDGFQLVISSPVVGR